MSSVVLMWERDHSLTKLWTIKGDGGTLGLIAFLFVYSAEVIS